jgi:hypothetical protein
MADLVASFRKVLPDGLPGDGPVFARLVVTHIYVMAWAVKGHTVLPEACNAVMFCALVERVSPGVVRNHCAEIFHPEVVGPGNWHVRAFNDVFPSFIIKMAVLHIILLAQ